MRRTVKRTFYRLYRRGTRLWRGSWAHDSAQTDNTAIFVLHTIASAPSDMAVTPKAFREQLGALHSAGYTCVDLDALLKAGQGIKARSQPSFAITFDDGYESVYSEGYSILREFGFTATLFLTVKFLDGGIAPPWGSTTPALTKEYAGSKSQFLPLKWSQARELAASSVFRIGSHSMNHMLMGRLERVALREELEGSRKILEDRLGVAVRAFSYPFGVRRYGAYSEFTEEMVRASGYAASFTSEIARARHGRGNYLVPRISLVEEDTGPDAIAKAAGAYDWVGVAQGAFQRIFPNPH